MKQVFSRDFIEEHLNLDRGILHTMRDLCYRPGHMVNDYLAGKRRSYFNFVGFLLIMLAVEAVISSFTINSAAQLMYSNIAAQLEQSIPNAREWLKIEDVEKMLASQKFIFLLVIPIAASLNWLIFRRMKYNVLEHSVAITFLLAMNTMFGFLLGILGCFPIDFSIFSSIYVVFSLFVLAMGLVLFWQFSKPGNYSIGGRLWRVLLAFGLVSFVLALSLQLAIGIFAGYRNADQGTADRIELFNEE